mmetsp:Transcript_17844/g.44093  ORF Transcript_17844/g.44093 Transcript_17844/m.44093 type:complete len:109 (-) Transcript_17844:415-741(-)
MRIFKKVYQPSLENTTKALTLRFLVAKESETKHPTNARFRLSSFPPDTVQLLHTNSTLCNIGFSYPITTAISGTLVLLIQERNDFYAQLVNKNEIRIIGWEHQLPLLS